MGRVKLDLTCAIFCVASLLSHLSPAAAELLTLTKAVDLAQEKSPEIQQIEEQMRSAMARARLALSPAEPTLSIMDNDMIKQFDFGTAASKVIQVTQAIGFPGRALLNRSMLSDQSEGLSFQLNAMKLQVGVNVKSSYYNLQLARKNLQLNADTRLAYERILSVAKRRYESGATAQVDYLNAQVALLNNRNDLADLETAEKQARTQLNVLLKRAVETEIEVSPIAMAYHPKIDLAQAIEKMVQGRNEIKAAQSQTRAAGKAYRLAWYSLLPDFQFTLGTTEYRNRFTSPYNSVPELAAGDNWPTRTYTAGVQITVPIWGLFNEKEAIVGAAHDRAAAERNLEVVFNQSKNALETVVDTIHANEIKIENFEKHILPLAEQSLSLAMTDYSSGKVDFQTLADTAAVRRQARFNYATAVVNYLTAYANYGQLIVEDFR